MNNAFEGIIKPMLSIPAAELFCHGFLGSSYRLRSRESKTPQLTLTKLRRTHTELAVRLTPFIQFGILGIKKQFPDCLSFGKIIRYLGDREPFKRLGTRKIVLDTSRISQF
jgi:hypothetical protein